MIYRLVVTNKQKKNNKKHKSHTLTLTSNFASLSCVCLIFILFFHLVFLICCPGLVQFLTDQAE